VGPGRIHRDNPRRLHRDLSPPGGTDEQALIDAIIGWELPTGTLLPASMHSAAIARDAAELARNITAPGGATALLGGAE